MDSNLHVEAIRPLGGAEVKTLVRDPAFPKYEAELRYSIEMPRDPPNAGRLYLVALELRFRDQMQTPGGEINAEMVGVEIPWRTWLRAAGSVAAEAVEAELLWESADDGREGLRVNRSGPARRRGAPYRMVATLYRELVSKGVPAPAKEIAASYKVSEGTARSWIHRARLHGYLGPANDRTAGESGFGSRGVEKVAARAESTPRGRPADAAFATTKDLLSSLKGELGSHLEELQREGPSAPDLHQAMIELGMAVFSRYAGVVEADGSPVSVRKALALITQVIEELSTEEEEDLDTEREFATTRFTESAFRDAKKAAGGIESEPQTSALPARPDEEQAE